MTLLDSTITRLRTEWTSRFVDTVEITEDTDGAFNSGTGEYAAAADATIYSGPGLMRPAGATPTARLFGDMSINTSDLVVYLPHTATGIKPGHTATVTSDDPMAEPLRVVAISRDSLITRRAVLCRLTEEDA